MRGGGTRCKKTKRAGEVVVGVEEGGWAEEGKEESRGRGGLGVGEGG